ncbi:hypothetical protein ACOMHN_034791 [Nucella lapillus]
MLKAADKTSSSRRSRSPSSRGQQFTWDNSNLEVDKPKNRYANVIAYDHSRVTLPPIDGRARQSTPTTWTANHKQNDYVAYIRVRCQRHLATSDAWRGSSAVLQW